MEKSKYRTDTVSIDTISYTQHSEQLQPSPQNSLLLLQPDLIPHTWQNFYTKKKLMRN